MQSYFDRNFTWISTGDIFHARNLQAYSSVAGIFKKILVPPKEEELKKEQRVSIFERFIGRALRIKKPPPPPPPPPTLLERFWRAFKLEGAILSKEVIASSAASVASVTLTQPFDVLKEKFISLPINKGKLLDYVHTLYKHGGLKSFYIGHMAAQRESLYQTVSMFYTQQRVYNQLELEGLGSYPSVCSFISGFLSATIAVVALKPIAAYRDRKQRRQYLLKKYGPIQAAAVLRRRDTFFSLFKGCFPDFMYLGTQYGLRFWIYNEIRDNVLEKKRKAQEAKYAELDLNRDLEHFYRPEPIRYLSPYESLIAGAASGIVSDVAAHPLEVISNRLNMDSLTRQQFCYKDTCRRYHQCFWSILRKHNLRGLYAGFMPTLIKSVICIGLQFSVYDRVMEWLDDTFGDSLE